MTDMEIFGVEGKYIRRILRLCSEAFGSSDSSGIELVYPLSWSEAQRGEAATRWYHITHQDAVSETAWRASLKREYGIDETRYWELFVAQNGVCAVCLKPQLKHRKHLDVDHNHLTGKVRGLLCSPCNTAIGGFKENCAALRAAADYLERHLDA